MARLAQFATGLFATVILLAAITPARAQTIQDEGLWLALFAQGDFCRDEVDPGALRWWFDGHVRFFDDFGGFGQSIVRPGVGYALTDRATVWMGYAWVRTSPDINPAFDENRIWQQLTWSMGHESVTVALRSRLEQRFLETGDSTGWRFRQLVRLQHECCCEPALMLVGWDELFVHLNNTDWGAESGFDQNRLFFGIGLRGSPESRWRTEIGYLNQYINTSGVNNISNHILSINLYRSP